jgi:hypothetical protein
MDNYTTKCSIEIEANGAEHRSRRAFPGPAELVQHEIKIVFADGLYV